MRSSPIRGLLGLSALAAALVFGKSARAADCHPGNGVSPCFDANALWLAGGDARFFTLPSGRVLEAGRVAFAVAASATWRPLRLTVPNSSPGGRDVELVKRASGEETVLAVGLGRGLELGLALPIILRQRGAGSEGLTSQNGGPLEPSAERDPRVSLSGGLAFGALRLKPRLTVTLPFGDVHGYASSGAFGFAPALPAAFRQGRFEHALELGLRLRQSVELGSLRLGSELSIAAGSSFELVSERRLLLCAELLLLPSLVDNQSERAKAFGVDSSLVTAEYVLSLRSQPSTDAAWTVALGAGSGLALSRQSSTGGAERFTAPGSPGLRVLVEVRYAPK